MSHLPDTPNWKQQPPSSRLSWIIAAACAVVAGLVLWFGLWQSSSEATLAAHVLQEKGASLISTLERALRTGMGYHWGDDELQTLLEQTADQPDVRRVRITDAQGGILTASHADSDPVPAEAFITLHPQEAVQGRLLSGAGTPPSDESFVVYRVLAVPRFDERLRRHHMGQAGQGRGRGMGRHRAIEVQQPAGPLYIFVEYAPDALRRAQEADTARTLVMLGTVAFLLLMGAVFFLLARRYEQNQRRLQERLRHSERLAALGNMAAGIAHEIRNPLSAIKGLARVFSEGSAAGSEEQRMADIMTQEVSRLDKVVSDLLDFVRPDKLCLQEVPVPVLLQRVTHLLTPDVQAQHIHVRMEYPQPAPVLRIDPDRMTQVLLNLCCNAMQALATQSGGGGHIVLRCTQGGRCIEVSDDGPGMSPEVRAQATGLYFTTRAEGTGLGLPIVHKIMEAHGGGMEIESQPGQGTTVRLFLPAQCVAGTAKEDSHA